jgi:PhzF family phenazine biosynthesis protein
MLDPEVQLVDVFRAGPGGGNPAPIVLDARHLSAADMQAVAARYGHESAFVLPAEHAGHDFRLRFFVPNHEMEMCGHATVGALWLLKRHSLWNGRQASIETLSGLVYGRLAGQAPEPERIEISQPEGVVEPLPEAATQTLLEVLGVQPDDLLPGPVLNARTSRVKTLIPLRSTAALHALKPDFARIEAACTALGSTGLYPFAVVDGARHIFQARQFPRSSGYPEDPATGIAAAALLYGLRYCGLVPAGSVPITIQQGYAMGRPSAITVRLAEPAETALAGCWLSGAVDLPAA